MENYMNFDTGIIYSEEELRQTFEQFREDETESFEDYLDAQLALGRYKEGGLIEVETVVVNAAGTEVDYNAAVALMDDDIREDLARELAPCTEQEFFTAYEAEHLKKYGEKWELSKKSPQY